MEKISRFIFPPCGDGKHIRARHPKKSGVFLARICLLIPRVHWAWCGCFAVQRTPSRAGSPCSAQTLNAPRAHAETCRLPPVGGSLSLFSRSHRLRRKPYGRRIISRSSPTEMEFLRMMIFRNLEAIGVIALVRSPNTSFVTPTRGLWCPSK